MRAPAQEDLSHTDEAQEAYRGYLLRRLVPAVAAFYAHVGAADAEGNPAGALAVPDSIVRERLAKLTTAELEGRLADLFDRLLMVRSARVVRAAMALWGRRNLVLSWWRLRAQRNLPS